MNNKTTKRLNAILTAYLSDDLPPKLAKEIRDWFAFDGHYEEKYKALENIWDKLITENHNPGRELIEDFNRMAQRLGFPPMEYQPVGIVTRKRTVPLYRRLFTGIAAVMIPLMILAGGFLWINTDKSDRVYESYAELNEVRTPESEVRKIILSDGTEVVLKGGSEFRYNDDRESLLSGEAYFKVAKGSKPFTVKTDHMNVTVLGTEFNLRSYKQDDVATVELYSGAVRLDNSYGMYDLEAGNKLNFYSTTTEFEVTPLSDKTSSSKPAWMTTALNFRGSTLEEIFDFIESYFGLKVQNRKAVNTQQRYTVSFEGDESPQLIMALLKAAAGGEFDYRVEADRIVIEKVKNE